MGMAAMKMDDDVPMTGAAEASSWWVVRTATRREMTALASLQDLGFTVYLPVERRWVHAFRSPTREAVDRPLFPGYLFVLAPEHALGPVWDADGVHTVVCIDTVKGPRPMAVPIKAVLELQTEEREGLFDSTRSVRPVYRPKKGHSVKITAGPWMNFLAKVLATPRGQRAQVMVEGPYGRGVVVDIKHLKQA